MRQGSEQMSSKRGGVAEGKYFATGFHVGRVQYHERRTRLAQRGEGRRHETIDDPADRATRRIRV